ncbi:MAG: SPOR domain-containing protein [Gammaproteobacteria bacterium]
MERATQERLVGATLLIVAGVVMIPWLLDGNSAAPGVTERELVLPGGNSGGNETRLISLELPRQDNSTSDAPVRELNARTVRDVDQTAAAINLPTPKPASTSKPASASRSASTSSSVPARFAKPMPESTGSESAAKPTPVVSSTANSSKPEPKPKPKPKPIPVREERKPAPVVATPVPAPRTGTKPAAVASESNAWAVQVGSFASQENAERLAGLLRGKSYKAFVMRNVIEGRVRYRVRVGPVNERGEADLLAAALREDRQPARVLSHP